MSFKALIAAMALSVFALPATADAPIMVIDPYARASTPSAKSGAIFLELMNHGQADRLIGAKTSIAREAQLHTHQEDANGVMRMIHVEEGFDLPAGSTLALARGGHHIMLMGLTEPLEQDDTVPLTLVFEAAGEVTLEVPVDLNRKPKHPHGAHSEGSHDDHSHGD